MLGERDRIRNAVGWELDESATSSNNNGVQQSSWVNELATENNSVGATARSYSQHHCKSQQLRDCAICWHKFY